MLEYILSVKPLVTAKRIYTIVGTNPKHKHLKLKV